MVPAIHRFSLRLKQALLKSKNYYLILISLSLFATAFLNPSLHVFNSKAAHSPSLISPSSSQILHHLHTSPHPLHRYFTTFSHLHILFTDTSPPSLITTSSSQILHHLRHLLSSPPPRGRWSPLRLSRGGGRLLRKRSVREFPRGGKRCRIHFVLDLYISSFHRRRHHHHLLFLLPPPFPSLFHFFFFFFFFLLLP